MCAEYVDEYNFDAIEGMELMVFERLKGPDDSVMMVSERTESTPVRQTSSSYHGGCGASGRHFQLDAWCPCSGCFSNSQLAGIVVKPMTMGKPCIMRGISVIRTVGQLRIVKGILGRTGANLHFKMDTLLFHQIWTIRCRR